MTNFNLWSYKDDASAGPLLTRHTPPGQQRDQLLTMRPAVQAAMYDAALVAGVTVKFGQQVEKVDTELPALWTVDGTEYKADLILGVDGLKSTMRRLLYPNRDVEPAATAECIFQASISAATVEKVKDRLGPYLDLGSAHAALGPGRFSLCHRQPDGSLHALLVEMEYFPPSSQSEIETRWNTEGDPDEVRRLFSSFNDPLRAVLDNVETCTRWRIAEVAQEPLESWSRGAVLLMGDAAHAMLPHAAQGVSQGIEGAVALAEVLDQATEKSDIPALLKKFEQFRRPRVEVFYPQSKQGGISRSLPDGPAQEARDQAFRGANAMMADQETVGKAWMSTRGDQHAVPHTLDFEKWEKDYVVVDEVHRFLAEGQ